MTDTQDDASSWSRLRSRVKDRLTREDRGSREGTHELHRQALSSTRGRVIAEALVVLIVGFTVDDLGLLRFPGYIVGIGLAVVILSVGGLYHAGRVRARLTPLDADEQAGRLEAIRSRGRLAAVITGLVFLAWMAVFTLGVPPWAL